ncbi:phage minor structural protein [Streptococcus suis]|uniref:Phage minor structural protein n=2 Tax=Streptococcus suis TaxID=1307 RepID=A0A0Z8JCQ0_STRSU|nr:gp58-like family protein [Streptococcus suis]CYV09329.1 phage minor structural protein [Streptococcus suis]CYV51418.1 phage minor structural protein [Streptococcus suis]
MVGTVTFNQAMLAKDRVFAIRAGTYTSSDIKEASFNYGYISGDTFKPGGTVAGSAKLTFTSIITSFNKLDKVYPEIGLKVGDSFEWVAMGEYFVNDINIDRNRNTTELDLIDGMFKLNQPYVSDLTYPAQIRDVIREICVKTGIELETDNLGLKAIQRHIEAKADKNDITFREVLSQAIQLLGFSAFFNRQGKLEVRGLTESRITVTADNYFLHGLTKSEIQYQIAGITCKKDKETLTVGLRTGRSLELENSFMNQNLLDELYYELKDIKYYPFSLDWQGHLKLDVGQWVTLKTNKNETYKVPVLSQSFSFKGGLKSKISADSKAGNDTQYSYKGFLTKQIEQMSTQIDAEIQQQLEYKDKEFDEKINKVKSEINDGIEQSRAEAERHADAIKQAIDTEITQVNQSMQAQAQEHDRQVADILSKTQSVEELANQAKSDAASALARANQVKTEAIADARAQVATVSQALNTAKSELQTAIASADQKARDSQASATALRNDLNLQASKILEQARAQTALTNRVSTVETLADGTRSTVAELSKTVSKATGDIASVSSRTKTVEDTLSQTRTKYEALTQTVNAQTGQIESINRKTADLQSGIDGVTERFENLRIEDNLLLNSSFNENLNQWQGTGVTIVDGQARITGEFNKTKHIYQSIKSQIANDDVSQVYIASISVKVTNYVAGRNPFFALYIDGRKNDSRNTQFGGTYSTANRLDAVNNRGVVQFATTFRINVPRNQIKLLDFRIYARDFTGEVEFEKVSLRRGDIDLGWQASPEDLRSEIASYKRAADEASAELSRQIQTVDGKAVDAKTYAQQTATAINTRLESLETYKNAEGARVEQYLTASREETARQLTAERTAIATNYVAKSTYDENVRGTALKLNEIKTTADTAKQNLATYQNTVDGKLEELTSSTQTLDGKISTASTKITQNANEISKRLTSTQVDKAITDKGYQTKSDVDNNITGRGYITSSALQPYALSTTVQNLVEETAGSFERQITETRGLIPTEVNQNLFDVVFSDLRATGGASFVQSDDGWIEVTIKNRWSGFRWLYSDNIKPSEKQYVLSYEAYLVDTVANTAYLETDFGSPDQSLRINKTPKRYTVVLNRPANIYNYINFVCNSSETGKKFRIRNIKLEEGIVATPYIAPFPTTVLFNAVKDTVDAHKRLIGNGDSISQAIQSANKFERSISSGGDIYQAIETAKGLVTEVSGTNGLKIQVSQLAGSYAVKNLNSSGDILSQANLSSAQFLLEAAKIRLKGKTLADEIQAIDGKFGTLFVADGTFAKLNATVIGSQAITADKLKVDQAFFDKLMANDAYLRQLFAKSAFITQVQAVTLSASKISGGILTATNGAMKVNLNAGQILYYTDQAALKRVLNGYPTQFVKFATGTVTGKGNAGVTVIGSNRWNSESSNDGGFVGIRAWNGPNIDQIDVVGDTVRLASSAFEAADGWNINTLPGKLDIDAFNADHRASSKIKVGDLWLWKNATTYSSMRDTINLIIDNLQLLHNNKSTERGYSYTLPAKV